MKATVQKWGNSLGLRIPKSFAQAARIADGSPVDLKMVGEKLVIQSLRPAFGLEDLLSKVTAKNIHRVVGTGRAVGQEEW